MMQEEKVDLHPKKTRAQGWEEIKISKEEFLPGDYAFKSKLVLLEDTEIELPRIGRLEKGKEIIITMPFSVEKDPKSQGFIKFEPISSDNKERYVTTRLESNSLVIEYNTQHSYIHKLMPTERAADLEKFLLETGIIVAFNQIMAEDIALDKPKIFKDINAKKSDPTIILPRIIEEVSKFMWNQ